ncbi:radical SAM protein [Eubacteriaceae bacterium ES3]|nr:radical SAM protein [Eubacteriaceae bacterium ES3]
MNEKTASICPVCLKTLPAQRILKAGGIYLKRTCPEHGEFETLVWKECQDDALQWEKWSPDNYIQTEDPDNICPHYCETCQDHQQQACCVLIELTSRCNQRCSFCFATSEEGEGQDLSLLQVEAIYDNLLNKTSGRPYNIQLSGGEPSLYKDLERVIEMGKDKGFPYIQLNTNGLLLGEDVQLAEKLKAAGLSSVFLQFDGIDDKIYQKIRGQKLIRSKQKAIEQCKKAGLGVVLVVTVVPGINDDHLGEILEFAIDNSPIVRGIHYQPISYFGRFPGEIENARRLTTPEFIKKLVDQSQGQFTAENFVPLESGHPRCSFHGDFKRVGKKLEPTTHKKKCSCSDTNIEKARDFIETKWSFKEVTQLEDDWDIILKKVREESFAITAMGFQDQGNLDLERLKKCRVMIATKDKTMIPFCAYNIIYRGEKNAKNC